MESRKQNVVKSVQITTGVSRSHHKAVVTNAVSPDDIIVYPEEDHLECEKSLFEMSHDEILNRVSPTHVLSHQHDSFDIVYFFSVTQNIIQRSTQIVDNIAEDHHGVQVAATTTANHNFNTPFCLLKSIVCEMACNASGEKVAHESTLRILKKLSTYPWEMKAVLALAAFASEYGEFSLLAQYQHADQLANSVAIVKGIPVSTNLKTWKAVSQLNSVIKQTLEVIGFICQLVNHSRSSYDVRDVTEIVTTAMKEIPVNVYWCIITTVACATNICLLESDEGKSQDLSQYTYKIQIISNKLTGLLTTCYKIIEEVTAYRNLIHTIATCTETVEVIKTLIYFKDTAQHIFDGSAITKEAMYVDIDILKKKNVLLLFSTLDISDDDISALKQIHGQLTKKGCQYAILWIPVVEQWTDKLKKDFETRKCKMPWYTVERTNAPIAGIKFIKEEWKIFKGCATEHVVVMDTRANILHDNALHMIRRWGIDAYPFTKTRQVQLLSGGDGWARFVVEDIHNSIRPWIKEEKYIFVYGGKDKTWIDKFTAKAKAIKGHETLKKSKIDIEIFHVERSEKGGVDDSFNRFFSDVESMFSMIKVHKEVAAVTKQVQKLLSYKNESGWAMLMKGSSLVGMGHGSVIYNVLENMGKRVEVPSSGTFDFSFLFEEALKKEFSNHHVCACVEVPSVAGAVLEIMSCHECDRPMQTYISYKCCHDGNMATNYYC